MSVVLFVVLQSKRKEKRNKKDAQLALESKPEKEGEEKKTTDTTSTSKQIVEKSETTKEKEESTVSNRTVSVGLNFLFWLFFIFWFMRTLLYHKVKYKYLIPCKCQLF